jgi:cellulose synthase/poly-beta-1,6-N-acetylglucosamine synthase-like glycosyltransferase
LLQRAHSTAQPRGRHGVVAGEQLPLAGGHSPLAGPDELDAARLHEAVRGLATRTPELSAATRLSPWQRNVLIVLLAGGAAGAIAAPEPTLLVLLAVLALPFLLVVALRAAALWHLFAGTPHLRAAPAGAVADGALPIYTVLVPLFREARVVPHLIGALKALDYPAARLEVLLIVETIDGETQAALQRADLPAHMRIVVVPDGSPRTKPRAVQYALQLARGAYVVIYDAEDAPEPDQLRRALAALVAGGEQLGCVQAQLNIYNSEAGWLTRQFTIEYTALFDCILPTLERFELPVPLGGTSNHFRRTALDAVGGWDPFNVTEDADLGIRLARMGWRVGVLRSTTWEEAPQTFRMWLGQRTRWLKGWMQTYLVHMRAPLRLWRELGPQGFIGLQVLMGAMILSALVHPWFYVLVALDAWRGQLLGIPENALGHTLLLLGIVNLVTGYISAIALGSVATARRGRLGLALYALMMPLYWLGISLAAYRALWQLVTAPYYWEKTEHFVGRQRLNGAGAQAPVRSHRSAERITSMPARSKAQQKAAGAALAAKRGDTKVASLKGASKSMYKSMSKGELKEFAETSRKDLPSKKSAKKS